jgi:HK97 family phage prohead protease
MDEQQQQIEYRSIPLALAEVRELGDGNKLAGYAALFDSLSEDFGGYYEVIRKGAFSERLQDDVRLLLNHESYPVFGRTTAGTLRLTEDDKGLWMEADLPDTQWARDLKVSIARGDITQMSFAFLGMKENYKTENDLVLCELLKIGKLLDVSVVTFPAYPATRVGLRSFKEWKNRSNYKANKRAIEIMELQD